jgi:uncharacterized protein (DUF58 family)
VFFALTLGVGFAALNTGNNLLYLVLSLMLAFLVLSGVLSESALRGISVRRRRPRELFAGAPALVALEVTNQQRRVPAIAIVVEDLVLEASHPGARATPRGAGRAFVLRIAPGRSETGFYRLRPAARGDLGFLGFRVSTRFPFGLFSKSLEIDAPGSALVYPAVEARLRREHARGDESGRGAAPRPAPGAEVGGLREFQVGDPARRIHWRASARRAALVVRQSESDRRGEREVRLRTRDVEAGEGFETAVRHAASELVAWIGAGARVSLRTDSARFAPEDGAAQRVRLLAFLARVQPDPPPSAERAA